MSLHLYRVTDRAGKVFLSYGINAIHAMDAVPDALVIKAVTDPCVVEVKEDL